MDHIELTQDETDLSEVVKHLLKRIDRLERLLCAIYDRDDCNMEMHELRNHLYLESRKDRKIEPLELLLNFLEEIHRGN